MHLLPREPRTLPQIEAGSLQDDPSVTLPEADVTEIKHPDELYPVRSGIQYHLILIKTAKLILIMETPGVTARDLAVRVGISEYGLQEKMTMLHKPLREQGRKTWSLALLKL